MRLSWISFAFGALASTAALADGLECQANILYGNNTTVRDVATGETVQIVPEAYLPRTQAYQDYSFNLSGGTTPAGGYTPIPAGTTTYQPAPPAYQPPTYQTGGGTPSDFLDGTMWRLVTLDGQAVTAPATLNFQAGGRYGGRAACNTYGGDVGVFTDFTIAFQGPIATRRACPQLGEEQAYFRILDLATDFRPGREGDTLALLDAGGVTRASFVRDGDVPGQVGLPIIGAWSVAGVLIDGTFSTDSGFGAPGLEFDANGQFGGNLGCNDVQGTYTQSGSALSFGQVAVTARQCFVPAPFEGPILAALPRVTMVQAIGGGISLRDASGTELIRLAR